VQIRATDGLVNFYLPGYIKTGMTASLRRVGTSIKGKFTDTNDQIIEPYIQVRGEVVAALGRIARGGASLDSRANAARALGILRGRQAIPDLEQALRSKDNQVIYEKIDWEDPRRKAYYARNREFIAQVCPLEDCLTEDPIQVMYSGSVAEMQNASAALRKATKTLEFSLAMTFYDHRDFAMVDVIRLQCSKGATLAEWAAVRGFTRDEVMAIGDNFNDREMLEFAGLPVVMANSIPELKSLGWRQTLSNDEGGVAAAIREYALENL